MAKVNSKQGQYHIGNGQHLTVKSSYTVQMKDHLMLFTGDASYPIIELPIEIKADFEKIPNEWHQILIQMMMVRYGGVVRCDNNTKPFEVPFKTKRRWYNFLKFFK
jgi:hypothetical protein